MMNKIILWVLIFFFFFIILYILTKRKHKIVPEYFSGERMDNESFVTADNFYWGFLKSMKKYYKLIFKIHDGKINTYSFLFILSFLLLFIILLVSKY